MTRVDRRIDYGFMVPGRASGVVVLRADEDLDVHEGTYGVRVNSAEHRREAAMIGRRARQAK